MTDLAVNPMTIPSASRIDFNTPALQRKRRMRALKDRLTNWYVLIGGLAVASALLVIGIAGMAAKARRRPVVSGTAHLIGASATVIEFDGGHGWALVDGERWQVHADVPLLMRAYMYAAGHGRPQHARHVLRGWTADRIPCLRCDSCRVRCAPMWARTPHSPPTGWTSPPMAT